MTHIDFSEKLSESGKTKVISVRSKICGLELGVINWKSGWRRYVFGPAADTVFDRECLKEIIEKIAELMNDRNPK